MGSQHNTKPWQGCTRKKSSWKELIWGAHRGDMAHTASAALPWSGLCCPPGLVTLPQSLIIFTCKSSSTREEKSVWPCRCLLRKKREENCKIATDVSGIKHQILLQLVIGLTFPLRTYCNNILIISLVFFFFFLFFHPPCGENYILEYLKN